MQNYHGYQSAITRALGSILPRLPIMGILIEFSNISIIGILGVRMLFLHTLYIQVPCTCTNYRCIY